MLKTCFDNDQAVKLIDRLIDYEVPKYRDKYKNEFITTVMAMELMKVSSPTTFQKLRNEGKISYYQLTPKIILYSKTEIYEYMQSKKVNKF